MHHSIRAIGNCIPQDETTIIKFSQTPNNDDSSILKEAGASKLIENKDIASDHDYIPTPSKIFLTDYKKEVITYIAGFTIKMVRKRIKCPIFIIALVNSKEETNSRLTFANDTGGLIHAHNDTITAYERTEHCFQFLRKTNNVFSNKIPMHLVVSVSVLNNILSNNSYSTLFTSLNDHAYDNAIDDNHIHILIKKISEFYSIIRLHHKAKLLSEKSVGKKLRQKLNRLVIFKNQ